MKNPFNPNFGEVPQILIQNDETDKLVHLIQESEFARSFFITGVQGSGKTTFLNKAMNEFQNDKNCIDLTITNKEDLVTTLCSTLESEIGVHYLINLSYEERLEIVFTQIKNQNKYVVIAIDDMTNTEEIQDFLQYFSLLKQAQYPIFVLMTGLPELILQIQNEDRLTFLLRSEKIVMAPLSESAIVEQYFRVFHCEITVAQKMAKLVEGYSYAFQLLGWLLFEEVGDRVPEIRDVERIMPLFEMRLFENAYQKIIRGLSPNDIAFLLAMNADNDFQTIVSKMGKDKVYVAQYRKRLIDRKLIQPVGRGRLSFTLPLFEKYLSETQDPDSLFYLGVSIILCK